MSAATMPITDYAAMMRLITVALRDREWERCPVGREVITPKVSSSRGAAA